MQEYQSSFSDSELAERHAQRAKARRKKQRIRRRRLFFQLLPMIAVVGVLGVLLTAFTSRDKEDDAPPALQSVSTALLPEQPVISDKMPELDIPYSVSANADTLQLSSEIDSQYAVVIDLQSDTILAEKAADAIISPASMTKVLTLLVGAELVEDRLDDTFTMTIDITDYCYVNECSVVGLMVGETVSVRELLYGTILPSGADAAMGLAVYAAGSHKAFVELMNQKIDELGLSDTAHFTNCVGLYDKEHLCTVYDMALIMKAAMENELCRKILDARTYETAPTADHPEGQTLSNWFLRRIEDKDTGDIEIIGAKTGYVVQSGSCAVSCGEDSQGNRYICATGDAAGSWKCIYDHVALYHDYCN